MRGATFRLRPCCTPECWAPRQPYAAEKRRGSSIFREGPPFVHSCSRSAVLDLAHSPPIIGRNWSRQAKKGKEANQGHHSGNIALCRQFSGTASPPAYHPRSQGGRELSNVRIPGPRSDREGMYMSRIEQNAGPAQQSRHIARQREMRQACLLPLAAEWSRINL